MSNGNKQKHLLFVNGTNVNNVQAAYIRQLKPNYGRDIEFTLKKGGEQYIKYKNQFTPSQTASHYVIDMQSQFDIHPSSLTHAFFCKYGCFTTRSLSSNVKINKKKPYKINVGLTLTKDAQKVLQLDV